MMSDDDNDGQMIFRDLGGLKLPDTCLTGEENPRKHLTQETCPDRGTNPGLLRDHAHAAAWPTSVDAEKETTLAFFYKSGCRMFKSKTVKITGDLQGTASQVNGFCLDVQSLK